MNKLGVIVPYRDREEHLIIFKKHITEYLNKQNILFELIIVEQTNDKPFNRGKLLNIGFIEAERLGCDYVVFHDVDMLPIDVDYSYSPDVLQLANNFISDTDYTKEIYDGYFGGVTMFPIDSFKKVNGYPNDFWGWGFEDDELLRRCIQSEIETDSKKIKNRIIRGNVLQLNGTGSYIKVNNIIDYTKKIKISTTFRINSNIDYQKQYTEWTIFSIPGYDMTLTAIDLFGTYKFELWDYKKQVYSINTNTLPIHTTTITIEINPVDCSVTLFQNREYVDSFNYYKKLYDYSKEKYFYIGNANPYRGNNSKEFYGYIIDFKVYNDDIKIVDLNIPNYKNGIVVNRCNTDESQTFSCELINMDETKYEYIQIPKKRKCIFKLIEHENNGFDNGKWKDDNTRLNQIKYNTKNNISGLEKIEYKILKTNKNHLLVKL
jgi:hypothetical protein